MHQRRGAFAAAGNLVSIDFEEYPQFRSGYKIYKGCNPACSLVSQGLLAPYGSISYWGHLDKRSQHFVVAESYSQNPRLDIYNYSTTTSWRLLYSITNGVGSSVSGAAFNPRSKE